MEVRTFCSSERRKDESAEGKGLAMSDAEVAERKRGERSLGGKLFFQHMQREKESRLRGV